MLPLTQILIHSSFILFLLVFHHFFHHFFSNKNNSNIKGQKLGYDIYIENKYLHAHSFIEK
jgi:hypothetical protein